MTRIALACAVILASLFGTSAQAHTGYKAHKPHVVKHYHGKKKVKAFKRHRRWHMRRRFHRRFHRRYWRARPYWFTRHSY